MFVTIRRNLKPTSRGGVEDTRLEAKAKDTKKFRGQEQTLLRPRPRTKDTDASVLKKNLQKFFSGVLKKKIFKNFFQAKKVFKNFFSGNFYLRKPKKKSLQIFRKVSGVFQRNFNGSKIVLSASRGQHNFRGLEASRPRPMTSKCVLEDSTSAHELNFTLKTHLFCQRHNRSLAKTHSNPKTYHITSLVWSHKCNFGSAMLPVPNFFPVKSKFFPLKLFNVKQKKNLTKALVMNIFYILAVV